MSNQIQKSKFFKIIKQSARSKARLGIITTPHGKIKTPAFMSAATKGTVKSLTPQQLKEVGVQVAFVNSYHLVTHPGAEIIEKAGGIHKYAKLDLPLMSDSGGFQVFSLARPRTLRVRKSTNTLPEGEKKPAVVKINSDGVIFRSTFDGKLIELTPEKSMEYQQKIGADLIMAFDECTYYPATYEYTKKAMERTHEWLKRSVSQIRNKQYLYGIIQGGTFEDLRKESTKFVISRDVDGIAIGGVSVGESKKEMRDQVKWVSGFLPQDKPVHLLGVGQIDDIVDLVKYGIDTFDCVEPTRLARMGIVYQTTNNNFQITETDILKGKYKNDLTPVDKSCNCYVCKNFSKSYLHHLFKQRELLAYSLATYHNLWVMEKLMEKIRELIGENKF